MMRVTPYTTLLIECAIGFWLLNGHGPLSKPGEVLTDQQLADALAQKMAASAEREWCD